MKTLTKIGGAVLGLGILSAAAYGAVTVTTPPGANAGCRCPLIYAPVTCSNGKTYSNQCVADCHHAKGCVPSGGF